MKFEVNKRTLFGKKTKKLRKQRKLPGIVYGKHLDENIDVQFDKHNFLQVFDKVGQTSPVELKVDGDEYLVMIHDYEVDPVSDALVHVDFRAIKEDEKIVAAVPVEITGTSVVEKQKLWKVEVVRDTISLEGLPGTLPNQIQVDVSGIEKLSDVIFIKDIQVADNLEKVDDGDLPVVTAVEVQEELDEEEDTLPEDEIEAEGEELEEGEEVEEETDEDEETTE